jgi:membrane protein required for colicin V production
MVIDILFLILLLMAAIKGFKKGFIVAVFSFLSFILGIAVAIKCSVIVAHMIEQYTKLHGTWLPFLAFLLIIITVSLIIYLLARLLENAIQLVLPSIFNKLAGFALYALLYTFILSVFLFYAFQLHILPQHVATESVSYAIVQPVAPWMIDKAAIVFPVFKNMFEQLTVFFEEVIHKK